MRLVRHRCDQNLIAYTPKGDYEVCTGADLRNLFPATPLFQGSSMAPYNSEKAHMQLYRWLSYGLAWLAGENCGGAEWAGSRAGWVRLRLPFLLSTFDVAAAHSFIVPGRYNIWQTCDLFMHMYMNLAKIFFLSEWRWMTHRTAFPGPELG